MEKNDTMYRCVILMNIRVACSLYKLAHAYEYLQCSQFLTIEMSIIHLVLHKFVHAIKENFKN